MTTPAEPTVIDLEPALTPEQLEMVNCEAPWQIWVCGRRWGKTLGGRCKMAVWGAKFPGQQIWYLSLSNRKSGAEYRRFLRGTKPLVEWKRSQPPYCVRWHNGTEFWFLSMDKPENIRGENCVLMLCDEAAKYSETDFWEILAPCTADTNGTIVLTSTFYGENWFHKEFQKGLPENRAAHPKHRSFLYPTPTGYAFQDPIGREKLEELRAETPGMVWDQEYLCIPSAKADAVFRKLERTRATPDFKLETRGRPGARYIFGWDTGGKADPSALIGLEIVSPELARVVHAETYPLDMETGHQLVRTRQVLERFTFDGKAPALGVDVTGTHRDWALGWTRQAGLQNVNECDFRPANKERMVQELSIKIEQGSLKIPSEAHMLHTQLKAYRYVIDEKGRYDYRAPDGAHDDEVAGLMIATWGWKMNWGGFVGGLPPRYGTQ